jgi:anti-anti-sigma regulatory factor
MDGTNGAKVQLTIPEVVTIAEVSSLAAECRRVLAAGQRLRVDGSRVQRIDTAGLQLLAALVADAARRRIGFEWSECSEALTSTARLLGMDRHLVMAEPDGNR